MKNIRLYIGALLMAVVAFTACSPDSFEGADGKIPTLDGVDPVVKIDQEINQVTFSLPENAKGVMPLWIFYENKGTDKEKVVYSTVDGLKKIFAKAGDYEAEFKLMNRNGVSDGSKSFTFHIDNTIMNFDKYLTQLCGGTSDSSKEWRIDNDKQGHMGCGPSGTTGTEWWSAGPNDKEGFGVYDCRLTFTSGYKYHFNPGESGQIYVNKDVAALGGAQGQDADFCVDAPEQEVDYEFEVDGDDLYIVFPANTYFPYIANDDIWNTPRYRVESITPQEINLVIDNGGIAWHYILTSSAGAVKFSGFKYDSEFNLWKSANKFFSNIWFADANWGGVSFGEGDIEAREDGFSFKMPVSNSQEWQGQVHYTSDINITAGTAYDFSCVVEATGDVKRMTVKICPDGDDTNTLWYKNDIAIEGGYGIVWVSGAEAPIDMQNLRVIFDFGGNDEGVEIDVKNIVLKDHANDDGTILPTDEPADEPGDDIGWVAVDSPENLMNSGELSLGGLYWAAGDDWHGVANADVAINNNNATITIVEANGTNQWQGQVHLNTGVAIEEGKTYNFCLTLNATQDLTGVTVKPHPEGDDGHMFSADRHDIPAFQDVKVKYTNFVADFSTDNLVITLDFPGCEAGTVIELKDIIIQTMPENLMDSGELSLSGLYWAAGDDWHGVANAEVEVSNNNATITIVEANGTNQWQGQVHLNTGVAIEEGATYDFSIILNATQDLSGVTVKPHPEGDDGHMFSADRHDLPAYTDKRVAYTGFLSDFSTDNLIITLDFPGCEAGTVIEVKGITINKK